jgi:hypothetical protein
VHSTQAPECSPQQKLCADCSRQGDAKTAKSADCDWRLLAAWVGPCRLVGCCLAPPPAGGTGCLGWLIQQSSATSIQPSVAMQNWLATPGRLPYGMLTTWPSPGSQAFSGRPRPLSWLTASCGYLAMLSIVIASTLLLLVILITVRPCPVLLLECGLVDYLLSVVI